MSQDTAKLALKPGAIGDAFKLAQAANLLDSGNAVEAIKITARVNDSALSILKTALTAQGLAAEGRYEDVLNLTKQLPMPPRPELSFGESAYADAYRRTVQARADALKALGKNNVFEQGELAILSFGSAMWDNSAAAPVAGLNVEQRIRLLHRMHFSYQFKKTPGVVSTSEIATSTLNNNAKCEAFFDLGDSLRYNPGQGLAAIESLEALVAQDCPDNLHARALYWIGKLAFSARDADRSRNAFLQLAKKFPDNRLADDAIYSLWQQSVKTGDAAAAKTYESKLLALAKGDMKNQFVFDRAWPDFERGAYDKAAKTFALAADGGPTPDESLPRILYWQARSLQKLGGKNAAKAKALYKRLITESPFSYYAVLAASRIKIPLKVPPLPVMGGDTPSDGDDFFATIDALNAAGFYDEASHVMDFAMHTHPEWIATHEEFIARKYMECHNYRKALDMASEHFNSGVYGPTTGSNDPMFTAFYPRAYAHQTAAGYARTGLPRGAIEGIMREESLFQRNARSWVGATGLMQLMPTTAQMLKRKLSDVGDLNDLTDPRNNILLGSTYLSDMRQFFNGQLPFAIMAYNAGPGNVKKWLARMSNKELDEFVENVPLSETQGYVKRVLRSMQVYGAFYKEPFFNKPFLSFDSRLAKR